MNQFTTDPEPRILARLIAPCGMNCALCMAYQKKKNPCPGCRVDSTSKPKTRLTCKIKTCKERNDDPGFCFTCQHYPCPRLLKIDKRYRTKYSMSFIDNLNQIKDNGLDRFLESESTHWRCSACGNLICVHKKVCLICGQKKQVMPA